jgi:Peptidase family C54
VYAAHRTIVACNSTYPPTPGARYASLFKNFSSRPLSSLPDWFVDWRRPPHPVPTADYATYVQILTWFFDSPSPLCPFSVHRMALAGKDLGKDVGQWFGPSTAAGAIKYVKSYPSSFFTVHVLSEPSSTTSQKRPSASLLRSMARYSRQTFTRHLTHQAALLVPASCQHGVIAQLSCLLVFDLV